jgi:HSP20 family molecular chaperone IbpA
MSDFFDYFFGFDKQFNYESLGMRTYKHISKENEEVLVVNVAGFTSEDISLETKTCGNLDYLYVVGKPKEDVKDFVEPLNIRFRIKADIIDEISGCVKDGLLHIIAKKKDHKSNIKIKFNK